MAVYYKLTDLDAVAKDDGRTMYIFDGATGNWEADRDGTLADRLGKAEGETKSGCERISKDEAQLLIGHEEDGTES